MTIILMVMTFILFVGLYLYVIWYGNRITKNIRNFNKTLLLVINDLEQKIKKGERRIS